MKIGPHIEVTREMIEAAECIPFNENVLPQTYFAEVYRVMRALEPGQHQSLQPREIAIPRLGVRNV